MKSPRLRRISAPAGWASSLEGGRRQESRLARDSPQLGAPELAPHNSGLRSRVHLLVSLQAAPDPDVGHFSPEVVDEYRDLPSTHGQRDRLPPDRRRPARSRRLLPVPTARDRYFFRISR